MRLALNILVDCRFWWCRWIVLRIMYSSWNDMLSLLARLGWCQNVYQSKTTMIHTRTNGTVETYRFHIMFSQWKGFLLAKRLFFFSQRRYDKRFSCILHCSKSQSMLEYSTLPSSFCTFFFVFWVTNSEYHKSHFCLGFISILLTFAREKQNNFPYRNKSKNLVASITCNSIWFKHPVRFFFLVTRQFEWWWLNFIALAQNFYAFSA